MADCQRMTAAPTRDRAGRICFALVVAVLAATLLYLAIRKPRIEVTTISVEPATEAEVEGPAVRRARPTEE